MNVSNDPIDAMTLVDRHARAEAMISSVTSVAPAPTPPPVDIFEGVDGLPDIDYDALSADVIASALRHHGALVVRGLLTPDEVEALRSFLGSGGMRIDDLAGATEDMDRMVSELSRCYRRSGFLDLVQEYLGEAPIGMSRRTLVRRDKPFAGLPWHQDAAFFRMRCFALNAWTALTPCGVQCPSLHIVPQEVDRILDPSQVASTRSDHVEAAVEQLESRGAAVQPELAAGDAVLFDEMTVHRTGRQGWAAEGRDVAITWFFAPSRFPQVPSVPIAL